MDEPFEQVVSKKKRKKLMQQQKQQQSSENYYNVLASMHEDDDPDISGNDSGSVQHRSKKAKNSNSNLNFSIPDPEARHVIIKCHNESSPMAFKKLDSFRKSDLIEELIGSFPSVKTLESGSLLVETDSKAQVAELLKINDDRVFAGSPASAEIAYHMGTVRGVVDDASICDRSV